MAGVIYLIHLRKFIKEKSHIYKIGRARNIKERIGGYPKDSRVLFCMFTENHIQMETDLISVFNLKFKKQTDIGAEYFEGNLVEMIQIISDYLQEQNDYTEITDLVIKEDEIEKTKKIIKPMIEKKDINVALQEYITHFIEHFSKLQISTVEFYNNFHEWIKLNKYNTSKSFKQLITILKSIIKVEIKTSYDEEGKMMQIIYFPSTIIEEDDFAIWLDTNFVMGTSLNRMKIDDVYQFYLTSTNNQITKKQFGTTMNKFNYKSYVSHSIRYYNIKRKI